MLTNTDIRALCNFPITPGVDRETHDEVSLFLSVLAATGMTPEQLHSCIVGRVRDYVLWYEKDKAAPLFSHTWKALLRFKQGRKNDAPLFTLSLEEIQEQFFRRMLYMKVAGKLSDFRTQFIKTIQKEDHLLSTIMP